MLYSLVIDLDWDTRGDCVFLCYSNRKACARRLSTAPFASLSSLRSPATSRDCLSSANAEQLHAFDPCLRVSFSEVLYATVAVLLCLLDATDSVFVAITDLDFKDSSISGSALIDNLFV